MHFVFFFLFLRCGRGAQLSGWRETAGQYSLPCQTWAIPGNWQIRPFQQQPTWWEAINILFIFDLGNNLHVYSNLPQHYYCLPDIEFVLAMCPKRHLTSQSCFSCCSGSVLRISVLSDKPVCQFKQNKTPLHLPVFFFLALPYP